MLVLMDVGYVYLFRTLLSRHITTNFNHDLVNLSSGPREIGRDTDLEGKRVKHMMKDIS